MLSDVRIWHYMKPRMQVETELNLQLVVRRNRATRMWCRQCRHEAGEASGLRRAYRQELAARLQRCRARGNASPAGCVPGVLKNFLDQDLDQRRLESMRRPRPALGCRSVVTGRNGRSVRPRLKSHGISLKQPGHEARTTDVNLLRGAVILDCESTSPEGSVIHH